MHDAMHIFNRSTIIVDREMRKSANVNCAKTNYQNKRADDCLPLLRPCLFNIAEDPCEMFNLADRFDFM